MKVEADIVDDGRGLGINIYFKFNPKFAELVQTMPGARFVDSSKAKAHGDVSHWRVSLDIETAKLLRAVFGADLVLGPELNKWAKQKLRETDRLSRLSMADNAELDVLPSVLPKLSDALHVGPRGIGMTKKEFAVALNEDPSYQTADTKFMADAVHAMNCSEPGTGKTLEAIAAVFEAQMEGGPQLVTAPLSALEEVWETHLLRWQPHPVFTLYGHALRRQEMVDEIVDMAAAGEPFWVVTNPAVLTYQQRYARCRRHSVDWGTGEDEKGDEAPNLICRKCEDCTPYFVSLHPELMDISWNVFVNDEFHMSGLANPLTNYHAAAKDIICQKKLLTTATPMGGVPEKLFGILQFMYPEDFNSKWRFAEHWLVIQEKEYRVRGQGGKKRTSKVITNQVIEEREEAFTSFLSQYMVRRLKEDVAPWLPPKHHVDLWVRMTAHQAAQYDEFAEEAEIIIEEEHLTASSILAEYTRLKQFADAAQRIEGRNKENRPILRATEDSGKLPQVMRLLEERGIRKEEPFGDDQVVIFSQFSQIVDMVCDYLNKNGIPADKVTGAVAGGKRKGKFSAFQAGEGPRVIVMTTTAGGVSVTLDRASTVIFLDETWNPDDQEQAEDRCHRVSRIHQVTVYYIRAKETIEEYIEERVMDKREINRRILDFRKKGLRATKK